MLAQPPSRSYHGRRLAPRRSTPSMMSWRASALSLSFFCPGRLGLRPTESPALEPFCRHPEARPVEVEQLDAVAPFVGEHKENLARESRVIELLTNDVVESVEGLAHVTGRKRDVDSQRAVSEADHRLPPSSWARNAATNPTARSTTLASSIRSFRAPSISTTSTDLGGRSISTSANRTSSHTARRARLPGLRVLARTFIRRPYPRRSKSGRGPIY